MIDLSQRPSMDDLLVPIPEKPVEEAAPPRPRGPRAIIWITCLAIIGGIAYSSYLQHKQVVEFQATGISTVAEVIGAAPTRFTINHYHADIRYTANGQSMDGSIEISPAEYKATTAGDGVRITYSPTKPANIQRGRVTAADVAADPAVLIVKLCTGLFAAAFLAALVDIIRK